MGAQRGRGHAARAAAAAYGDDVGGARRGAPRQGDRDVRRAPERRRRDRARQRGGPAERGPPRDGRRGPAPRRRLVRGRLGGATSRVIAGAVAPVGGAERAVAARAVARRARSACCADGAAERRARRLASLGYVNIYADPWASVSVDGKPFGSTPLPRVALAAGVHRVRLENPKARTIERLVHIESGKTELLDVDLDSKH